jgi:putative membrane protein
VATADRRPRLLAFLALSAGVALVWSGIGPRDRLTWWLEVAPVLLAAPVLAATYRRFPLTPLVYWLIWAHALILIVGGHYTYAEVPAGDWLRDALGLRRNHYDRLGHLFQGFEPAITAREVFLRVTPLRRGGWLFFLVTCFCLAFSAFYELIEWWTAVVGGEAADSFLGAQGDVWDSHWDMFLALVGALLAQLLLARLHDRQLARLTSAPRS